MIKYACAQAEAHQVSDRVEFRVMDALRPLEFPVASFDLVNVRFGASFLRTWDWPKLLTELLQVTRPDGVVRVTEGNAAPQSNSPTLTRLYEMLVHALYRAGHLFEKEDSGLTSHLARLLDQYGCKQVQTKAYALEYLAGTSEGDAFYEDAMLFLQTIRPFIHKWGSIHENYEVMYQQALKEMWQPDFHVTWNLLTAWGNKPQSK
jgi:ubiquinone/menaquinone biosynthesis C-methylase UbiE